MKKIIDFLRKNLDYIIIIIVVILVRTFLVTPAVVDGSSMDDTLKDGQVVLINKINYRFNEPKRFQIVVVKNYEDNDKIIKRIIGLPGETIEYIENKLYINGLLVSENYSKGITNDFKATTGDGEYFVLGDNREVSKDSRVLGNFTKKDIIGNVNNRIYPFDKIGKIK